MIDFIISIFAWGFFIFVGYLMIDPNTREIFINTYNSNQGENLLRRRAAENLGRKFNSLIIYWKNSKIYGILKAKKRF